MSNWTHVAGIIRVDCLHGMYAEPDFDQVFGKEIHFNSPYEDWDDYYRHPEKYLPAGSEGSLTISIWANPKESHVTAYAVSIFGDLRDHDSPDEIIEWFKDKCSKLWVRNACVTATNEYNGTRTWVWEDEDSV